MICTHCSSENPGGARFCARCGVILGEAHHACGTLLDQGRYEVRKLIKSGGMGAVYLAYDTRLNRERALKEMVDFSPAPEERKKAVERFENEVKILSSLSHPSLPQVSNFFVESGHYYMVMDYIEGEDLEYILQQDGEPGLSEKFISHVGIEICRILEYLHGHCPPILNRDIKPSNIMIGRRDRRVYLVDFGIAKALIHSSYRKTAIGTEGYAPLEQYRGYPEPRSDLYALGATMYHLLTGMDIKALDFKPVRTLNTAISPAMERILAKALQLKPEDRFAHAAEMREALEQGQRGDYGTEQSGHPKPDAGGHPGEHSFPDAPSYINPGPVILTPGVEVKKKRDFFAAPAPAITTHDGMVMIYVEKGPVIMGTPFDDEYMPSASQDEMPCHSIEIPAFYMDRHPVTNRQFEHFARETGYHTTSELRRAIETWKSHCRPGKENHPVVCVSWFDAVEYAAWAGKRLPTEAEWERAARGCDGRPWPWGHDPAPGCLNCWESHQEGTTDVLSYPAGRSPFGIYDMAGNVREWTGDWYRPYPYSGPYSTGYLKSIRGSSFSDRLLDSRSAKRWENSPSHRDCAKGFRCVQVP